MRPGQNKRMRGRNNINNNNRRGPNPLTRSYESNGPDVKIRGTAHHIGEKYLQLARDAQSSGDPVMAESYLQHAEHYFRLIASAQQAQQQAQAGYQRQPGEVDEDDGEDDDFSSLPDRFASPSERVHQQPQSVAPPPPQTGDRQPYEQRNDRSFGNGGQNGQYGERAFDNRNRNDRQNGTDRSFGERQGQWQDRQNQDRQNQDRPHYQDRQGVDRQGQERGGQERQGQDRQGQERQGQERGGQERGGDTRPPRDFDNRNRYRRDREFRDNGQPREQAQARDQDQVRDAKPMREAPAPETKQPFVDDAPSALPAFITAPTRQVPEASQPALTDRETGSAEAPASPPGETDGGFTMRPRRRRRPKSEFLAEAGSPGTSEESEPAGD